MKIVKLTFIFILVVLAASVTFGVTFDTAFGATANQLKVHFIDVGQADAIFIQTPGNKNMLIDTGTHETGWTIFKYLTSLKVKRIDVLVVTHPHEDHIGGLPEIVNAFPIGQIYMPKVGQNTKAFEDALLAIQAKGLKVSTAKAGLLLRIDPALTTEIIAPNDNNYDDLNDYSAVIKMAYGKTAFLFMGDAGKVSEREILQAGYNVKADVLKVGHHGSNTSTTGEFLNMVAPTYAVISVGSHNEYGHPGKYTLGRLRKMGVKYFRTDQSGTVIIKSDGQKLSFM